MPEPILCYVDAPWAYFTTQPLEEQWGDDWGDTPYEHNAEEPYEPRPEEVDSQGNPLWRIIKVAFDGDFDEPRSYSLNSPWSVRDINAGAIPWLRGHTESGKPVLIPAGTTLEGFVRLIKRGRGQVYFPGRIGRSWRGE
jgi:hypothetical protein